MSEWSEWSKSGVKVPSEIRADLLECVMTSELRCKCTYIWTGDTIALRIQNPDGTEEHIEAKIRRRRSRE